MLCLNLRRLLFPVSSIVFLLAVEVWAALNLAAIAEASQDNVLGKIELRIVNGGPINRATWPEVVQLRITRTMPGNPTNTTRGRCTGTLLARETIGTARIFGFAYQDVILTAAHCIAPDTVGRITTWVEYRRDASDTWQSAQDWGHNNSYTVGNVDGNDTALVFFNGRNGFTNGLPMCERPPNIGDQVTLVGFGCNNWNPGFTDTDGDGILDFQCTDGLNPVTKRTGVTTIQTVDNITDTIGFTGPMRNEDGTAPGIGSGDSGSPYILQQNGANCVAAITSGVPAGGFFDNDGSGTVSNGDTANYVAANLHRPSSRTFLRAQLPGVDCDIYEVNCRTRFIALHQFIYRRPPNTNAILTYFLLLTGDLTTLGEITTEFRTDIFSRMQPAWAMFLEQP